MTDSFVTQCPHCQTSFRVSHAQLSVARGVVRCGSCLQVFNAAKQLLEQAGKEACRTGRPGHRRSTATRPNRAPSAKSNGRRELDLDSLDLDEELARLEQREIQPTTEFGRHREDTLSARRDTRAEEPGPTACSAIGADRAQTEEEDLPEPEPVPKTLAHRTFAVAGAGGSGGRAPIATTAPARPARHTGIANACRPLQATNMTTTCPRSSRCASAANV
jgi:predicted Zn finger-like uncharacterized protein